jgi:hypothetical protein
MDATSKQLDTAFVAYSAARGPRLIQRSLKLVF